MIEQKSIAACSRKRAEKERHYDYLEETGKMMDHRLSEKPYILRAVQEDERLKGNGVKK